MTKPSARIRLLAHTPDHLRALLQGEKAYEERFALSVADGVKDALAGPDVSERFLERLRGAEKADFWRDGFGIVHLAENRLVGLCSFNDPPDGEGNVEISYVIAPRYMGRGFATEAARLLIERAFATGRVRRVRAHTLPEKSASTRVLEKCGLQRCGEVVVDPVDGPVWLWEMERVDLPCQSSSAPPASGRK